MVTKMLSGQTKKKLDKLLKVRPYGESVQIAIIIVGAGSYEISDNTKGAVYYYAHNLVYPSWADKKEYIGVLGNHTFMK